MRSIVWPLAACLLSSPFAVQAETPLPSPTALLAEIEVAGPRIVLERLWANDSQFNALSLAIESGEADWLEVARRLKPASDAGVSLSLNYSVARAIPVAPTRVLGLVGRGFTVEGICTSPFIEPVAGVAERYEQRALQALATLEGSALASVAEQCAARVRLPTR
jgi:hypothetical protein